MPPSDLLVKIRSMLSNEKGTFGNSDGHETAPKK